MDFGGLAQDKELAHLDPGVCRPVFVMGIHRFGVGSGLKDPSVKVARLLEKPIMGLAWRKNRQFDPWK